MLLVVFAASCGADAGKLYASYEAEFDDYSKIDQVENRLRGVAKDWEMEILEKDRDQMAFVTQNSPAFFIAMYFEEDPILIVTNVGVGNRLVVSATDHGSMPIGSLEELFQSVLTELEALNLEFHRVE